MHYEILAAINERGFRCKNIVSNHLSDIVQQLNATLERENQTILQERITETDNAACTAIQEQAMRHNNMLAQSEATVKEGCISYKNFRQEANPPLERLPDYSDRKNAFLWVTIIALVEITLNASLLMEVNQFGLLGAIMQMGIITAINIVAGMLLMGSCLRYRNLMSDQSLAPQIRAWGAWLVMVVLVPIIGAFNLLVGHFRDSMQKAIDTGANLTMIGNEALQNMITNPFEINSFQSSLLVVVGIICFGIASWKGYRSDDPYPGYGRRHRQLNAIIGDYHNAVGTARQNLEKTYKDHEQKLEDIRHSVEIKQSIWIDLHERGQRIISEYPHYLGQYQHDLNHLVAVYRDENQRARTEPPPDFFNQPLSVDQAILEPPLFKPPAEGDWANTTTEVHEAIREIQGCYEQALGQYPALEDIAAQGPGRDNQE